MEQAEATAEAFLQLDKITSLQELREKLDRDLLPSGAVEVVQGEQLVFFSTQMDNIPKIAFYLQIGADLSFEAWCNDVHIAGARLCHIATSKFSRASEVLNTIIFLKNLAKSSPPADSTIEFAITLLEVILHDLNDDMQKKMSFLLEQLNLITKQTK